MRWKVFSPLGYEVILRELTFKEHILNDHDPVDSAFRAFIEPHAKLTIERPDVVVNDNGRHLYYRLISWLEDDTVKIRALKVVVDTDRSPHGVVTWTLARKGDSIKKGVVLYDISNL